MVVMMPVMMPDIIGGVWDGTSWKDTYNTDVHLYPKNEIQDSSKEMNVDEADVRTVTIRNENGEEKRSDMLTWKKEKQFLIQ